MDSNLSLTQQILVLELKSDIEPCELTLTQIAPVMVNGQGGSDTQGVAADNLMANRLLRMTPEGLAYLDANDPSHAGLCAGVSLTAAMVNQTIRFRSAGVIKNEGWSFSTGAILYATGDGIIGTAAGSGFFQQVGVAISPTEVQISLGMAIVRSL